MFKAWQCGVTAVREGRWAVPSSPVCPPPVAVSGDPCGAAAVNAVGPRLGEEACALWTGCFAWPSLQMLLQVGKGPVYIEGANLSPGPRVLARPVVSVVYPAPSLQGLAGGSQCAPLPEPLYGLCGPGWVPAAWGVGNPLFFFFLVSESRPQGIGWQSHS